MEIVMRIVKYRRSGGGMGRCGRSEKSKISKGVTRLGVDIVALGKLKEAEKPPRRNLRVGRQAM